MLEDRPIVQKTLVGSGAFAFVFLAAMGGSAVMISGGFGAGEERAAPFESQAAVVHYVPIHTRELVSSQGGQIRYETEETAADYWHDAMTDDAQDLALDEDAFVEDAYIRSEEDIRRDIEREYAAQEAQAARARQAEYQAFARDVETRIAESQYAPAEEEDDLFVEESGDDF